MQDRKWQRRGLYAVAVTRGNIIVKAMFPEKYQQLARCFSVELEGFTALFLELGVFLQTCLKEGCKCLARTSF